MAQAAAAAVEAENREQSAFLRCLAQLDVDTWAEALLPFLQGSLNEVTLTCRALRQLRQQAVQQLDMRLLCNKHFEDAGIEDVDVPSAVVEWTQALHERFPRVSSVHLEVQDEEGYSIATSLLPALSRLPKLSAIQLFVEGEPLPSHLAPLLASMRTQLSTKLTSFRLEPDYSLSSARQVWRELGKLTQLSQLQLCFKDCNWAAPPCTAGNLKELSKLCSLKDLCLSTPPVPKPSGRGKQKQQQPVLPPLRQLTALTALRLTVHATQGMANLSHCSSLEVLALYKIPGLELALGPKEWAVVGKLSQLTCLVLASTTVEAPSQDFSAVLRGLPRLQHLGAKAWGRECLPLLAELTALTSLGGGWLPAGNGQQQLGPAMVMPGVKRLESVAGDAPFEAFPNLNTVWIEASITAAAMHSLTAHCKSLELLLVDEGEKFEGSVVGAGGNESSVAAINSIAGLKQLQMLRYALHDDTELAALVGCVRDLPTFHTLRRSHITCTGLMQLGRLAGLPYLKLELHGCFSMWSEGARLLLAALRDVGQLHLIVPHVMRGVMQAAQEKAQEIGLTLPKQLDLRFWLDTVPQE